MMERMAECALLVGRPDDAVGLLQQLDAADALERRAPPPRRLALLATAQLKAGALLAAARASAAAVGAAARLEGRARDECALFWTRRGDLLLALHRALVRVARVGRRRGRGARCAAVGALPRGRRRRRRGRRRARRRPRRAVAAAGGARDRRRVRGGGQRAAE